MSTIAAISTPNAPGGIAVIRISGENALGVAERIFSPYGEKNIPEMKGYTCAYGIAHDKNERIDDCILTVFRAPHSYTGEDIAEISCHGGLCVSRKILRTALKNGAENAEPGEFTKRAYLNGKIDLTQAESVMDIISAKSERELKIAESLREGAVFKKAAECSDRLLKILGDLAAWADYPEEDIPEVRPEVLTDELKGIRNELLMLLKNYDSGRILREGVATAIVGRPNVGKSTLFNYLAGCERSIVTDIAGTTRDVIEETVRIGDVTLRLSDTAGIRDTDDVIEGIGVEIAGKILDSSELVLAVFDGSCPFTADDLELVNKIKNKNCIAIINKDDSGRVIDTSEIEGSIQHIVYLSAKEHTGIDVLQKHIEDILELNEADFDTATASNERQKRCIDIAAESIESAISALETGELLDAVNILIDEAEQSLLQLMGRKITEAVVDEVFSRFCVGK